MRIFWQSFVDQATSAPYMARLAAYLNEIAAPGTSVHVEGITPADREFGRLSEFRCAIQAVDNGLAAQERGFDAYVMGHFQDPGLYELRSALTIPVIGTGEATLLAASGHAVALLTLRRGESSGDRLARLAGLASTALLTVFVLTTLPALPATVGLRIRGRCGGESAHADRLRSLRAAAGRSRR